MPSGVTEKVKVDIETPEQVPEDKADLAAVAEDPEGTVFLFNLAERGKTKR